MQRARLTVSIVMPTINRKDDLLKAIESICSQTRLPEELIIVDQSKDNNSKKEVHKFYAKKKAKFSLKYIHDSTILGLTHARNVGIDNCSNEVILFLDDDVILDRDYIKEIIKPFLDDPRVGAVGGVDKNLECTIQHVIFCRLFSFGPWRDGYRIPWYKDRKKVAQFETRWLHGGLMAVKKQIAQEFRFDESFISYSLSEDTDFVYRVSRKYKTMACLKARATHKIRGHGERIPRAQTRDEAVAKYYFFKKHMSKKLFNIVIYLWSTIGLIIKTSWGSMQFCSILPLVGLMEGFFLIYKKNGIVFLAEDAFEKLKRY